MSPSPSEDKPPWLLTAEKKRGIQAATIAPFTRLEGPADAEAILAVDDVGALAEAIARGRWTAFEVAVAYVQKAAGVGEKVRSKSFLPFGDGLMCGG